MNVEERSALISRNWPEAVTPHVKFSAIIQRLNSLLVEHSKMAIKGQHLTVSEFDVLAALRSCPEGAALAPTALYDALLISSGGLTKILKSLENQKLIARSTSASDARQRPVMLTESGKLRIEAAMADMVAFTRTLLQDGFSDDEACDAVVEKLKDVVHVLEEKKRPD
ncbi:MarR family winged helix-turn-helix transcriptional regulator [uncultured Cohaesibacter sp.]|uniref:MarR family winged helix-turn-helix transcriptional regulator n=1 Tax=uncultured Cohaesibacter sp. TaxID=1002546 RepID=UPI00292FA308|nr:MarR family winged helix-turn-helix transcriptional regulator [uncultured Cohaesibacter sp.]